MYAPSTPVSTWARSFQGGLQVKRPCHAKHGLIGSPGAGQRGRSTRLANVVSRVRAYPLSTSDPRRPSISTSRGRTSSSMSAEGRRRTSQTTDDWLIGSPCCRRHTRTTGQSMVVSQAGPCVGRIVVLQGCNSSWIWRGGALCGRDLVGYNCVSKKRYPDSSKVTFGRPPLPCPPVAESPSGTAYPGFYTLPKAAPLALNTNSYQMDTGGAPLQARLRLSSARASSWRACTVPTPAPVTSSSRVAWPTCAAASTKSR